MRFVLDASVALSWCFEDEQPPYAMHLLDAIGAWMPVVPSHWFGEVANGLAAGMRRKRTDARIVAKFFALLRPLPLEVESTANYVAMKTMYGHAMHYNTSAYDAAYLLLAMQENIPLATIDQPLRKAMQRAGIALFSPAAKR